MDRLEKARKEVEKLHGNPYYMMAVKDVLEILDTQEYPICEDLDKEEFVDTEEIINEIDPEHKVCTITDLEVAAIEYFKQTLYNGNNSKMQAFKAGAKWGRNQAMAEIQAQSMALAHGCPEEPVSEDLETEIDNIREKYYGLESLCEHDVIEICEHFFKFGANWQKEKEYTCYEEAFEDGAKWKVENLWKPADGDDLPEIDREVIALLYNGKVVFAHRPPEYWDGKDIITGKVTRNYVERYDKGLWNIPDVKWWLDCSLPNMED